MQTQSPGRRLDDIKVLIIDDAPDLLELTRLVLEQEGARVITFESVVAAIQALTHERADVFVVDIDLPTDNGYVFIGKVRRAHDETPAIALTGYTTSTDRDVALAVGFQVHMAKPFNTEALVDAVYKLANMKKQKPATKSQSY